MRVGRKKVARNLGAFGLISYLCNRNINHPNNYYNGNDRIQTLNKGAADGRAEIMVRFFHGRGINQSTGTEIFASPEFFEYYIDKEKSEKQGIRVPAKTETATIDEAEKFDFVLRNSGTLTVSGRRLRTPDVIYHEQQRRSWKS